MRFVLALPFVLLVAPGCDKLADAQVQAGQPFMNSVYKKVSGDAEEQYGIAARNGTAIDRCVAAGMVAAAHLQAKDEDSYAKWKSIEAKDCQAAGIPR